MKYKLIALDLDGTLYNSEKKITKRTYDALMKAQSLGVKILLSSGRSYTGIKSAAKDVNLAEYGGYISSFNGGKIVDYNKEEVLFEQLLKLENTKEIYDLSKKFNTNILAYIGEDVYFEKSDEYIELETRLNKVNYHQVENLLDEIKCDIPKFILLDSKENLDKVEPEMQKILAGRFTVTRSEPVFLEVMPCGIDKGESLKQICKILGIDIAETISFGDSFNDIAMLQSAGLGVAMANAHSDVKKEADVVTLSNNEDGIAEILEKYLF